MPWKVESQGDLFVVVREGSGKVVGKHPSRSKALAHLRALYAAKGVVEKGKFATKSEAAKFAAEQRWKNHAKKTQAEGGKSAEPMTDKEMNDLLDASMKHLQKFFPKRWDWQSLPGNMPDDLEGDNLSKWAAYALEVYQLSGYRNMNAVLRGEDAGESDGFFEETPVANDEKAAYLLEQQFDELALKMPRDTVVYRGMVLGEDEKWEKGDVWLEQGFVSTSMDKTVAQKFGSEIEHGEKQIVMTVRVPKGHSVCVPVGAHDNEREVMMRPGTKFRLVEVQKNTRSNKENWIVELVTE